MRGGRVPRVVTSTQDRRLELRVTAGPAYHNRAVVVKIAYGLEFTGQPLFQVKETDHIGTPGGGPGVPGEVQLNGTLTVGTDGLARVTLVHQLGQDDDLRNIFAQATVSGPENEITNLVNLWLMSVN